MDWNIKELTELIETILGPEGCPWGRAQEPDAVSHYVIEESYEVIDAVKENDIESLEEELGDVLFATLFTLISACKKYDFDPDHLIQIIVEKVKRRHPHVFEDPTPITLEQLRIQWEEIKAKEREGKPKPAKEGLFSCIAKSMPSVTKAMKLVELGTSKGFEYQADEATLEGRFLKLIIDGLNEHENLERIFENGVRDYKAKFEDWMKKEKPEMIS